LAFIHRLFVCASFEKLPQTLEKILNTNPSSLSLPVRLSNTKRETELRYVALSENMPKITSFPGVETTIGAKEPSTEWTAVHHAVRKGNKPLFSFS